MQLITCSFFYLRLIVMCTYSRPISTGKNYYLSLNAFSNDNPFEEEEQAIVLNQCLIVNKNKLEHKTGLVVFFERIINREKFVDVTSWEHPSVFTFNPTCFENKWSKAIINHFDVKCHFIFTIFLLQRLQSILIFDLKTIHFISKYIPHMSCCIPWFHMILKKAHSSSDIWWCI